MTVRLTINYEASDGSMPANVDVAWEDDAKQPTTGDLIEVIEGVARIAERRGVPYELESPTTTWKSGGAHLFVAAERIEAGQLAGLLEDSRTAVVPLSQRDDWRLTAIAAEDLNPGDHLGYTTPPNGAGKEWRRVQ